MPQFLITSPEGTKYRVNAPEGATQADAMAYLQANIGSITPENSAPVSAANPLTVPSTTGQETGNIPLSVRNNNPLNLKSVDQSGFRTFATPEEGEAANKRDLLIKIKGQSDAMAKVWGDAYIPTLNTLLPVWAPKSDNNDTDAYIKTVAAKTGLDPDQELKPDDVDKLYSAMVGVEGGKQGDKYFNDKSFLQRTTEDYNKRVQSAQTSADRYQAGDISLPGLAARVTGNGVAGFANDVIGEVGKSALSVLADATPDRVKDSLARSLQAGNQYRQQYAEQNPNGLLVQGAELAGQGANSALESIAQLRQNNPNAAEYVDALGNVAGLGMGLVGAAPVINNPLTRLAGRSVAAVTPNPVTGAKNVTRGFMARNADELDEASRALGASDELKGFSQARSGIKLGQTEANQFLEKVRNNVLSSGKLEDSDLHAGTAKVLKDLEEKIQSQNIDLEDIHNFRQRFQRVANSINPQDKADVLRSSQAIDAIDDSLDGLDSGPELRTAIKASARKFAFDRIADIAKRAEGDPAKIKSMLKTLANSKRGLRGLTPTEQALAKKAYKDSGSELALRFLGNFGLDTNSNLRNFFVGGSALGGSTLGASNVALPLVLAGTGARQITKLTKRGKLEELLKAIENRPVTTESSLTKLSRGNK